MTDWRDVDREALHDWLDVREDLRRDEMPDRADYEDDYGSRAVEWEDRPLGEDDDRRREAWLDGQEPWERCGCPACHATMDAIYGLSEDQALCEVCGHPLLTYEQATCQRCDSTA